MYMATTVPKQHIAACNAVYIVTEIIVWTKDDFFVLWKTVNHLLGITACHYTISQRLYSSRGVYIAHYLISRVLFLVLFQILSLTAVSKRATSIQVRTDYGFVRTQEFACLSHEVHATHNHYLGIGFCSFTSQSQRVANKVGDVLNLTYRIVVGEDNSIFLLAKLSDFSFQVQGFVNWFVNVSFLNPFFFHHNIHIIFLIFYFFKKEYRDDDMPWISG